MSNLDQLYNKQLKHFVEYLRLIRALPFSMCPPVRTAALCRSVGFTGPIACKYALRKVTMQHGKGRYTIMNACEICIGILSVRSKLTRQ